MSKSAIRFLRFMSITPVFRFLMPAVLFSLFTAFGFYSCSKASPKFKQYYNHGEQLYLKHCSNCHQKDGSGLGRVYPPLNTSDYMTNHFDEVLCLIRNGVSGEMVVNGKQYNQAMPGIPTLTDLEVAEIATYIYNSWSHERGIVEVRDAATILNDCGGK